MKARFDDRNIARELRRQGSSFSEIMEKIPNLSKGTLNGWLKDIELTQDQKNRLLVKMKDGSARGRLNGAFANREKRINITKLIMKDAREQIGKIPLDPFFAMGIMLYWAEGDKSLRLERVAFTNSDPLMIKLMMKWFREICYVPEDKFRIRVQIMTLHDRDTTEQFWSELTNVPLTKFNKIVIKPTSLKGKRNPSYMGTCTIFISNKNIFRKIMGWKFGIIENLNVTAPMA